MSIETFDHSALPVAQIESLRFKANQIIESIKALQMTIDFHPTAISAWPDILSKYNLLLSQTHSFSSSLTAPLPSAAARLNGAGTSPSSSPFEKIALHPRTSVTDIQLDTEIIPLLRNQQTTDVLSMENETVRRLSEHMVTRGSVGVLSGLPVPPPPGTATFGTGFSSAHLAHRKPEYEDVLQECDQIRGDHDRRAERAKRAVSLLRDKFEWKPRVAVEVEEPEELDWDPRHGSMQEEAESSGEGGSSDEDEVEGNLVQEALTNGDIDMG